VLPTGAKGSPLALASAMGSGGYKSVVPKWDRMEQEMLTRGVTPETIAKNWSERSKHWFYVHGGSVDPDTRALVWG